VLLIFAMVVELVDTRDLTEVCSHDGKFIHNV